MNNISLANKN